MLPDLGTRRPLLLQGPNGPFFRRLAEELRGHGAVVTKVNFNAADSLMYRRVSRTYSFREPMTKWPDYLSRLLDDRKIDAIFLFGDCRPHHKVAVTFAKERDIPVWVFEEGYLRPDYITLERGGVNGHSALPKDPEFYRKQAANLPEPIEPQPVGPSFWHAARYAAFNSVAVTLGGWRYPHYRHHRSVNTLTQAFCWARGGARKLWYQSVERDVLDDLATNWSGKYFLVALQVHCDAQLQHTPFEDMEQFIEDVVATFAAEAPSGERLVLKHHPRDRPYRDYTRLLRELGERYHCSDRLVYVHDLHLPTLIRHARGVVALNSTVGTLSLHLGTPFKAMGDAIYDMPGLTFQGALPEFFVEPGVVDTELYAAFERWIVETTQLNGNFYKPLPGVAGAVGMLPTKVADSQPSAPRETSSVRGRLRILK